MKTAFTTLAVGIALLLVACSPRNGLPSQDDDDSAPGGPCNTVENTWPEVLPEFLEYEGDGSQVGDHLYNFQLRDQVRHGRSNGLLVDLDTVGPSIRLPARHVHGHRDQLVDSVSLPG